MKLYTATVTFEVEVVWAGNERPSEFDMIEAATDDLRENPHVYPGDVGPVVLVDTLDKLPNDWRGAIPYGYDHDGDRTCLQILDDYTPEREPFGEQLPIDAALKGNDDE